MYKEANGSFPINMRYLNALGAGAHYFMFFIMIFFITAKHVSSDSDDTCF